MIELSRDTLRTVLLLPHFWDSSIIPTLGTILLLPHSGQFYYYHTRDNSIITTLGTILLLPHSRESSIITTLSGQFYIELSRECGNNTNVPRV
jgi:hypothetical protein